MDLPLGSYRLPQPAASGRQLTNCYAESIPPQRQQQAILMRAPGIAAFVDTAEDEVRGLLFKDDLIYSAAGEKLFSVTQGGTVTEITGVDITGSGPVRMADNPTDIVIGVSNAHAFSSDGSSVVEITDPDFTSDGGGLDPVFVDGYMVFRRPDSARFINSGINTLAFDGLDITEADGGPDNLVGLLANNRELILPGVNNSERWYNAANDTGSPFSRSPQGFYEIGCAAGGSLCNQDNAPFMLANDLTFRKLGGTWERVSHHGIESMIQRMSLVSDCIALPYKQEGHHFIAWTFRNAGRTVVLDLNTGEWHERESRVDTVSLGRWRPQCIVQAWGGKYYVGDSVSGKIGLLDPDTHEEWGEPQVMSWTYQAINAHRHGAIHKRLEIGLAAGQGTVTGQGSNPKLTLHVSDDGGNTFRTKPSREIGRIGEYRRRIQYHSLGQSKQRVYRCDVSDPVRTLVLDTQVDAPGGYL